VWPGNTFRTRFSPPLATSKSDGLPEETNGKWFPVVSVEPYQLRGASLKTGVMVPYDRPGVDITYGKVGHIEDLTEMIPAQPNIEAVAAFRNAALVYQQTLTQAGVPRRKAA
jgi:hypothetical protein